MWQDFRQISYSLFRLFLNPLRNYSARNHGFVFRFPVHFHFVPDECLDGFHVFFGAHNKPGKDMREKVGVYADAGYPNYVDADKDGFPDDFAPSKRLAVFFGAHPDYYETYRAYPDKTFNPAVKNEKGEYVADETYKSVEGGHFVEGNLPRNESQGVHTVDDLVVTARGPKSEEIKGFMNSTEIFRVMAEALALGH
jgi:alkaline phosphatase